MIQFGITLGSGWLENPACKCKGGNVDARLCQESLVQKLYDFLFTLSVPPPLSRTNVEDDEAALGILTGLASPSFLEDKILHGLIQV